jgi:hypothetical protein
MTHQTKRSIPRPEFLGPFEAQQLDLQIRTLRRLNKHACESGDKRHRYSYLRFAYEYARLWSTSPDSEQIARALGAAKAVSDTGWFIGRILRLTSRDDRRLRSKHATALKYAAFKGVSSRNLRSFLRKKGGLNACADRMRRFRKKARAA